LGDIGMPSRRAAAIKALAMAVASGEIALQVKDTLANFIKTLTRIPGIGDWTAQYIAMRALGEPDAFPCADLGIIKALQEGDRRPSPKRVRERAEAWRPWRAYAAICLWWG
jgi:3-methyladenine DNA glycosylase/8-oxoguanine DNA glycosylase